MDQEHYKSFKQDFGLLIEAGFVAVKQLDEIGATRLFQAAQVLNAHSVAPRIGLGYIALNKLEVKEAAKIFRDILKEEADNMLAQVFLGICYLLTKPQREEGEKLVQEAMEKTSDPAVINLAKVSLEWAEKDLKSGKRLRVVYDDGTKKKASAPAGTAGESHP